MSFNPAYCHLYCRKNCWYLRQEGIQPTQAKSAATVETTFFKLPSDTRTEIKYGLFDFDFIPRVYFKAIAGNDHSKLTSSLQLQIVKAVECTSWDLLNGSYFNSYNGLKTSMFQVGEQALGEVVRSGHNSTAFESKMWRLFQISSLPKIILHLVLYSAGYIVLSAEIGHQLVDRAVDEHCLRYMRGAPIPLSSACCPVWQGHWRYLLIPSRTKSCVAAVITAIALPTANGARNWCQLNVIQYLTPGFTSLPSLKAEAADSCLTSTAKKVATFRKIRHPLLKGLLNTVEHRRIIELIVCPDNPYYCNDNMAGQFAKWQGDLSYSWTCRYFTFPIQLAPSPPFQTSRSRATRM